MKIASDVVYLGGRLLNYFLCQSEIIFCVVDLTITLFQHSCKTLHFRDLEVH